MGTEMGPHRPHRTAQQRALRRRPASPHPAAHPSSQGFLDSVVLTSVLMGSEQTGTLHASQELVRPRHILSPNALSLCAGVPAGRGCPSQAAPHSGIGWGGEPAPRTTTSPSRVAQGTSGLPTDVHPRGSRGDRGRPPVKGGCSEKEAKGQLHNLTPRHEASSKSVSARPRQRSQHRVYERLPRGRSGVTSTANTHRDTRPISAGGEDGLVPKARHAFSARGLEEQRKGRPEPVSSWRRRQMLPQAQCPAPES